MGLIAGTYVFYNANSVLTGTTTVTITHVVAVNEHGKIVYITESQKRVLEYLAMAVSINILIVIVLGLFIKFRPKTKLASDSN